MDESVNENAAETAATTEDVDLVAADDVRGSEPRSAISATGARELSINELEKLDDLLPVARDFNLHLHPARSRHHHILDIARAALGQGANVTAEGFLDQVADSFGLLRYPELNFLAVPEDVYVPRAAIELYHLRPGQKLAGKLRLPRERSSITVVPGNVIGSFDFFFERHLRFDHGFRRGALDLHSPHKIGELDIGRTGDHHHAVAQGFTTGFIKKWNVCEEKFRRCAVPVRFNAPLPANPGMENLF